jgi:CHASE2 domain-containing sensor protein
MSRKYILVSGAVLFLLIVFRLGSGSMNKLEQGLLDVRYHIRGQVQADTNVVILYFDNDDISSLGGFPLKRNIYALLIDVLMKSNAKVIAFDILFSEPNLEYPEHDELLAAKAASSGRVVCSSYFGRVDTKEFSSPTLAPDQFPALGKLPKPSLYGSQLQLPYRELLLSAAGIGHLNTTDAFPQSFPCSLT